MTRLCRGPGSLECDLGECPPRGAAAWAAGGWRPSASRCWWAPRLPCTRRVAPRGDDADGGGRRGRRHARRARRGRDALGPRRTRGGRAGVARRAHAPAGRAGARSGRYPTPRRWWTRGPPPSARRVPPTELARSRHAAGANSATEQIDKARQAVSASEAAAAMIHLGPERRLLAAARTVLDEARAYQRAGDLETAAARARARGVAGRAGDRPRRRARGAVRRRRHDRAVAALEERDHRLVAARRPRGHRGGEGRAPDDDVRARRAREDLYRRTRLQLDRRQGPGRGRFDARRPVPRDVRAWTAWPPISTRRCSSTIPTPRTARSSAARAAAARLPASARIGGLIEIHGGGGRQRDWTDGCVAVTNPEMDDLFRRVSVGTPVTIVGSDTYGPIAEFADRHRRDAGQPQALSAARPPRVAACRRLRRPEQRRRRRAESDRSRSTGGRSAVAAAIAALLAVIAWAGTGYRYQPYVHEPARLSGKVPAGDRELRQLAARLDGGLESSPRGWRPPPRAASTSSSTRPRTGCT